MKPYKIYTHSMLFSWLLAIVLFSSCKKDKLEGDTEILKGEWSWINTQSVTNACDADSLWNYTQIDSSVSGNTFTLEFLEKGKVKFYHNDGLVWNHRIVFETKEAVSLPSYSWHFLMYLNNKSNDEMEVWVGEDSLLIHDYPLDTDEACEERFNHFTKN